MTPEEIKVTLEMLRKYTGTLVVEGGWDLGDWEEVNNAYLHLIRVMEELSQE